MKVLIINGSPRANGNTSIALKEMIKVFDAEGVETEVLQIGNKDIRSCIACGKCARTCPSGAITMQDNLPVINYDKCIKCGKCAEACPRHTIKTRY